MDDGNTILAFHVRNNSPEMFHSRNTSISDNNMLVELDMKLADLPVVRKSKFFDSIIKMLVIVFSTAQIIDHNVAHGFVVIFLFKIL